MSLPNLSIAAIPGVLCTLGDVQCWPLSYTEKSMKRPTATQLDKMYSTAIIYY